ncbi:MAG: peptide chain release factor N(5)-glutamine methyltransferase [Acidobacteriota bacterium]|nr:peptide chain release factor N(5)-glutamine methyltransferase [Acidobacteriota bacterium]
MTLRQHLTAAKALLVAAGIEPAEAARDVLFLAMHALGWDRATVHARDLEPPPDTLAAAYDAVIERRTRREPIAYITGVQEFWNRDFAVSPAVLIPRPETELIIEEAMSMVFATVADIGTGSGCLAVTLAAEFPRAQVVATDISAPALEVARANARRHGVADRIAFRETPYLDGVTGPFDLIVSNPPYVTDAEYADLAPEVHDFEPRSALASGAEGLDDISGVLQAALAHLVPGGRLLLEMGHQQAGAVTTLIAAHHGLHLVDIRHDLQGIARMAVIARRIGE